MAKNRQQEIISHVIGNTYTSELVSEDARTASVRGSTRPPPSICSRTTQVQRQRKKQTICAFIIDRSSFT